MHGTTLYNMPCSNIEAEKMPQGNQSRAGFAESGAQKALLVLLLTLVTVMPHLTGMAAMAENDSYPQIIGTVSSSDGPVEGARVVLTTLAGDLPSIREVATGPNGSYAFVNLTYGSDYSVEASFNGTRHAKTVKTANDTQRVDFRFTGSLEVEVRLPDGTAAVNVTLQLYTVMGINEVNATTDSTGIGVFEQLDVDDPYEVYLIHERVPYSKIIGFEDSNTSKIEIQILETTTSDAYVKVPLHHVIISQEGDDLGFWEAIDYLNAGETVFNTSWLRGWMQPGAFDISHTSMDCCIQFSEEGPYTFDPMDPLFPGDVYFLEIWYTAEAKVPTQVIEKKIVYDTEALYFLVQEAPKFTAESLEGLELLSVETYDGIQYYNFKGSELKAGDVVRLRLKTELTVLDVLSRNPLIWGSLLFLIPAGAVVYVVAFRKTKGDPMESLEQKKRELFSGLAEAEKNFNEGKITRDAFEKLQKDYKERSIRVLKEINKKRPGKKPRVTSKTSADKGSETTDLLSELKAVDSVLRELRSDYEGGAITKSSYNRISARYQERRSRIEERLRIAGVRDDRKAQEE
jgi:hypothetical protein